MEKDPHINQDLGNIFLEIERSNFLNTRPRIFRLRVFRSKFQDFVKFEIYCPNPPRYPRVTYHRALFQINFGYEYFIFSRNIAKYYQ